jgi:serine/threonine-protein phosphatase 2B catalytic subunit
MWDTYSEGSENASEFNVGSAGMNDPRSLGARDGMDALGVQGNQIRRYIHSFDDACVSASLWVSLSN